MALINPHINFNGNAEEAFRFYQSVFGGEFQKITRFKEISTPEYPIPAEEGEKLMNIALPIGPNVLIGNDVPSFMGQVNEQENRSKISVQAKNREEATWLFTGLSAGGNVEVPPDENTAAPFFTMFRDKYGIEWIVTFEADLPDVGA